MSDCISMSLCLNVEVVCTTTCTELPWRKGSMTSREKIWLDRLLRTCDLLCKDVFAVTCLAFFRKCGANHDVNFAQDSKLKGQVERYQKVSWTSFTELKGSGQNVQWNYDDMMIWDMYIIWMKTRIQDDTRTSDRMSSLQPVCRLFEPWPSLDLTR